MHVAWLCALQDILQCSFSGAAVQRLHTNTGLTQRNKAYLSWVSDLSKLSQRGMTEAAQKEEAVGGNSTEANLGLSGGLSRHGLSLEAEGREMSASMAQLMSKVGLAV